MKTSNSRNEDRLAVFAVDSTDLHVCVSSKQRGDVWSCETRSLEWRVEATSLNTERGQLELTDALRRAVSELKLTGAPAWVSLPGSYCVTRIATGDEDHVRDEMNQLKDRSELYLSLGHGPKSLASSIHSVDARHRHASLSVVHKRTLDTLMSAFAKAGLGLERVESSAVSLSRLVGRIRDENSPPALILSCDERGAEVGIVHRGLLMLDYRPASVDNSEQIATTLLRHLGRLRRYCERYIGITSGQLEDIYLLGTDDSTAALKERLSAGGRLNVLNLLDPWEYLPDWQSDGKGEAGEMAAPLGLSMLRDEALVDTAPNLLTGLQAETRAPLHEMLRPLFIPLAATLAAIALGWLGAWYQSARCGTLEREFSELELEVRDARLMQIKTMNEQQLVTGYRAIESALRTPDLGDLVRTVAHCLPADTWLDSINIEQDGSVRMIGGSYSDDGVFEFARWLAGVPQLANVAVDGTRPGHFPGGPGLQFDVHGEITAWSDEEDRKDGSS